MEIIPKLLPTVILTIPFVLTFIVLRVVLFRPLFDYLDARKGISEQANRDAESLRQASVERLQDLEQRLASGRQRAGEIRKAARVEAQQQEVSILAEARNKAEATVAEALSRINTEKETAATTLRGTARVLSGDIARQVLRRTGAES